MAFAVIVLPFATLITTINSGVCLKKMSILSSISGSLVFILFYSELIPLLWILYVLIKLITQRV